MPAPTNLLKRASLDSTTQLPSCFNNSVLRSSSLENVDQRRSSVEIVQPKNNFHGSWIYKENQSNDTLKFFNDRILQQNKSKQDHFEKDTLPMRALT